MIKPAQKQKTLIILIVILALLLSMIALNKPKPIPNSSQLPASTNQTNTFHSKILKFTISLPNNYLAQEKLGSVAINTNTGTITIGQNGTNYSNLKDYIENSRNDLKNSISNKNDQIIYGLEAVSGFIGKEKTYLIYANNRVYFISTKDPYSFNDLDQIAQSFRYIP